MTVRIEAEGFKICREIVLRVYAVSQNNAECGFTVISELVIEYTQILMGLVYMRVCRDLEHIFLLRLDYPTFQAFVHRRALLKTLVNTFAYRH